MHSDLDDAPRRGIYSSAAEYGLFERIPEAEMAEDDQHAIIASLDTFAKQHAAQLAELLGPGALGAGFHIGASVADVRRSFEEDGFSVVGNVTGKFA